ncbi:hypothetical protein BG46_01530 [Brucella anthropi]|uniref:hypothetical protein n=1 Tax=Brucella anthropi TaxID=529 RepID=UPI00044AA4CA|nr:hypothetical protein [Brucella anthropi]EXL08584.1 hypothetical protein BG46_01530 [Brucella anthropi]
MKGRFAILLAVGTVLTACQTMPNDNMIWLRTDGQSQVGNPHLAQQFQIDSTVCKGETQKSAVGAPVVYSNGSIASEVSAAVVSGQQGAALNDVLKGCMAQKGYMLVPKDQAAAIAAQYRANAKQ